MAGSYGTPPPKTWAKMVDASPQEPRRGQPAARPLSPSPAAPSSSSADARYTTPGAKAKVPSLDVPTSSTGPYSHRAPTGTWRSSAAASSARASVRSASARLAEPAKPSIRRSAKLIPEVEPGRLPPAAIEAALRAAIAHLEPGRAKIVRAAVLKALPPSADGSISLADFGESWRETVLPLLEAAPRRSECEREDGEAEEAEEGYPRPQAYAVSDDEGDGRGVGSPQQQRASQIRSAVAQSEESALREALAKSEGLAQSELRRSVARVQSAVPELIEEQLAGARHALRLEARGEASVPLQQQLPLLQWLVGDTLHAALGQAGRGRGWGLTARDLRAGRAGARVRVGLRGWPRLRVGRDAPSRGWAPARAPAHMRCTCTCHAHAHACDARAHAMHMHTHAMHMPCTCLAQVGTPLLALLEGEARQRGPTQADVLAAADLLVRRLLRGVALEAERAVLRHGEAHAAHEKADAATVAAAEGEEGAAAEPGGQRGGEPEAAALRKALAAQGEALRRAEAAVAEREVAISRLEAEVRQAEIALTLALILALTLSVALNPSPSPPSP